MATSFLPMSFQDSRTASDGLGAGFGGAAFLASCARAGSAPSTTATSRAPHLLKLFIVSLLIFLLPLRDLPFRCLATDLDRDTLSDARPSQVFLLGTRKNWPFGRVHLTWKFHRRRGKSLGPGMVS